MAARANIDLTPDQIQGYVSMRQIMPGNNGHEDNGFRPWTCCDQVLLDKVLETEQRKNFRAAYENIFT